MGQPASRVTRSTGQSFSASRAVVLFWPIVRTENTSREREWGRHDEMPFLGADGRRRRVVGGLRWQRRPASFRFAGSCADHQSQFHRRRVARRQLERLRRLHAGPSANGNGAPPDLGGNFTTNISDASGDNTAKVFIENVATAQGIRITPAEVGFAGQSQAGPAAANVALTSQYLHRLRPERFAGHQPGGHRQGGQVGINHFHDKNWDAFASIAAVRR